EQRHAALRSVVDALTHGLDMDADRTNEDQLPVAPAVPDPLHRLLGAADIADEIGVDHLSPSSIADRHQRVGWKPCAGDQNVEPTEFLVHEAEQPFDLFLARQIAGKGGAAA